MSRLTCWLAGIFSGVAAVLTACGGSTLDPFDRLKPGVSTPADVREALGTPTMTWEDADGSMSWEYPRMPQGVVNYMVDFGPDRRMREVRQVLSEANFARVEAGMSLAQIRRLLGQPAHELRFALSRETVWDWKIAAEPGGDRYFNVHFDDAGRVLRTSVNTAARG